MGVGGHHCLWLSSFGGSLSLFIRGQSCFCSWATAQCGGGGPLVGGGESSGLA